MTKVKLNYASAFIFQAEPKRFMIGQKMYQYVKMVYDLRFDGRGSNTLMVVYNFRKMKYEVLDLTNTNIGEKDIIILPD